MPEPTTTLATSIAALFGMLKDLADIKQRRRRETFEKILIPINTKFQKVHADYIALFQKTIDACPRLQGKGFWTCEQNGKKFVLATSKEVELALQQLKEDFLADRKALDSDRIVMKIQAARILNERIKDEEKRFVWGIISYLLYPDKPLGAPHFIDAEISAINRKKSGSLLRTPSSDLYNAIEPMTDADDIQDLVEKLEGNLKARWSEIITLWTDLEVTVVSETTPSK